MRGEDIELDELFWKRDKFRNNQSTYRFSADFQRPVHDYDAGSRREKWRSWMEAQNRVLLNLNGSPYSVVGQQRHICDFGENVRAKT